MKEELNRQAPGFFKNQAAKAVDAFLMPILLKASFFILALKIDGASQNIKSLGSFKISPKDAKTLHEKLEKYIALYEMENGTIEPSPEQPK